MPMYTFVFVLMCWGPTGGQQTEFMQIQQSNRAHDQQVLEDKHMTVDDSTCLPAHKCECFAAQVEGR